VLIFRLFTAITLVLLSSCADSPAKSSDSEETVAPVKLVEPKEKAPQNEEKTVIDPDVLFMLLTAEIAGQRGQYGVALEGYTEAAKRTHDPKLAERAAMIAMYIKDGNKTDEAVGLWLQLDSKNQTARKISALSALSAGNNRAAVEHLNALLAGDPEGFENVVIELAGALQKDGKITAVSDALNTMDSQQPGRAEIYFLQSLLAMQQKDKNLAESKIQQALKVRPDWDKALIFQAQIAVLSGDLNKAKALLKEASAKYPDNSKIAKVYAQVLIKAEDYEAAIQVYQGLISADPKDMESQFAQGLVHLQLNHDEQAEDIFTALLEQPEWKYQASFYLGKIEEKRGHTRQALAWFDKVTDGPLVFDASVSAVSLLAKDKQFAAADSRVNLLQAKFPKQKPRLLLLQAELYSQQKQYERAFKLLTDALVDFPDQKELLYTQALVAERVGKLDVVEADLRKILAMEPDNVEALNALGYTLLNKPDRYADAEKYLQKALKLEPDAAVIIDSYGWLQFKLGHNEKALEYLQRAYDKQKENEIAAHLARVLWALGRKDEAKEVFDKAIKETPDDEYLLDFKRQVLDGAHE